LLKETNDSIKTGEWQPDFNQLVKEASEDGYREQITTEHFLSLVKQASEDRRMQKDAEAKPVFKHKSMATSPP
jgi:hypothetical protein